MSRWLRTLATRARRPRRLRAELVPLEERVVMTGTLANIGLTPGWATFGQVLPQGAAFTGLKVGTLETQTDVKTRWPDGSIRFAVVTTSVPAAGTYPLTEDAPAAGDFSPTLPDASVRFDLGGAIYTATLPATPSADAWLNGPLVEETRTVVAPVDSNGNPHPNLRVTFDVRSYADGATRLDVTAENTLDRSDATRLSYSVDVIARGQTVYHHDTFQHYYLTRWRKTFDLGLSPSTVTPDFGPANQAGAIPPYLSIVTNQVNTATGATYDLLQPGALDTYMPGHGGRPELAPYPDWAARYLVHRDPAQLRFVLANGDLSGSWPIHLKEPDGPIRPGGPTYRGVGADRLVSIDERPNFWLDRRADPGNSPAADPENYMSGYDTRGALASPLLPDIAHQPSIAYLPYLLTGDRYYADEVAAWANYTLIRTYQDSFSNQRGGSQGLLQYNEVRGIAWGLRNLVDAAAYLPDADPVKAYLGQKVANNLAWLDNYARSRNNPLGILWENKRPENDTLGPRAWIAMWEQNYLAWAIDHANLQGFAGGLVHRDKIVQLQLKLFTSEPDYRRSDGAPYVIPVGVRDSGGRVTFYTSMAQLADGVQTRPFAGYYGPEARLNLMIAVREGMPGAQDAYDYLWPSIGVTPYIDNVPDLARRAGWAIASTSAPAPPPPPDTTPPTVTGRSPAPGATGVSTSAVVTATFSEAVQPGTISFVLTAAGGGSVPATVTYDSAALRATLTPSAPLAANTTYTASVRATDLAGNAMPSPVTWSFTTAAAADTTPPTVVGRSPAPGATGVSTSAVVTATFSEAVQPGTISFVLTAAGGGSVPATVTYDSAALRATLTPSAPLAAGTTYTASVRATDLAGNAMPSPVTWSFTTTAPVDTTPPTVVGRSPAPGATGVSTSAVVTATFSEAVQPGTISFVLTAAGGGSVPATVTYDAGTTSARLTPSAPLAAGTTYTASVRATDLAGNAMPSPVTWSFTTAAATSSVWRQTTTSDFDAGTHSGTVVTSDGDGAVRLVGPFEDQFNRSTLGSDWTTMRWTSGGAATLSGGILTVAGVQALSTRSAADSAVEGRINFGAATFLHFGLATGLGSTSGDAWAIFSTRDSTNSLYARVNSYGNSTEVRLGALPTGYHVYRVQPVSGGFQFYIDGVLRATVSRTISASAPLKVALSSYSATAAPLRADWVRIASLAPSGTFTSSTFDAGRSATWGIANWTASVPAGTTFVVETSSSSNGSTWSSWSAVSNGGTIASPAGRYLRYRVRMTSSNPDQSPILYDIALQWG